MNQTTITPASPFIRMGYLVSQYPAVSHTFILREVRALREKGLDIHVASINPADRGASGLTAEEREERQNTFYVKRAGMWGVLRAHLSTLIRNPGAYLRGLAFAVKLGGWDIRKILFGLFYFVEAVIVGQWMVSRHLSHLHVHFATPAAMVGLLVTKIFPMTYSMTVHGPDEFYDAPGYRLAEKIRGAAFVCCIGLYARSQIMKLIPAEDWGKLEVSPLGVDMKVFQPCSSQRHGQKFEILCVGRIVPAKGQRVLIEAVALLEKQGHQVNLRLVGDGPDRRGLEEMVGRRGLDHCITFEGAVDQDRIRGFYESADVFVLPSFAEGIPVVLMEAMAMEIPTITTWITGIPELIRQDQDGILVPPSDVERLTQAIRRVMDDEILRRGLGQAGRRRVAARYNLQNNILGLVEIFTQRLGVLL
jgi:glycosyltransferase involved in cell wall biosynthesis